MSATDRVKAAWLALLGAGTPRVDYYTTYRCKVLKQSADLSKVDIKPDDPRIPQRSDVPIKWGLPGVRAKIAPGCFMNHGWDDGDPSKPYAILPENGASVLELYLTGSTKIVLNNGALNVARATDQVTGQAGPYPLANGQIVGGNPTIKG